MMAEGRSFLKGCPMKPLCPLVQKRHRLEVSIVETHREGGKVRQKHIASIAGDSPAARESFWLECEAKLARLANRLGPLNVGLATNLLHDGLARPSRNRRIFMIACFEHVA
jgi:hypothetical protein